MRTIHGGDWSRAEGPFEQHFGRVMHLLSCLDVALGSFAGRSSESARLLRLAKERKFQIASIDELLARHLELVRSGADLPRWALEESDFVLRC